MGLGSGALAEVRARQALEDAGLDPMVELKRTSSVNNEVWLSSDLVVRVNRTTNSRLRREAELAEFLPPEVGYPPIVAYGGNPGRDWLLLRRLEGRPLAHCWPDMDEQTRRTAIAELVTMLKALHHAREPIGLAPVDAVPHLLDLAADPVVEPLLHGLERMRMLEHIDPALVLEATELVEHTAQALEPYVVATLIHGDLTMENVLWHDGHVVALLDFEWSRAAPRDLELDILLRFCAFPFLHVAEDYEHRTKAEDWQRVPEWVADDYPELFAYPSQMERLRLYSLAFDVREILAFPPQVRVRDLSEFHPYHRIHRMLQQRDHLEELRGSVL